jgi:ATP-dependent Clp protease protease subunit
MTHFSNLHTGLKEPLAPRADDDEDEDKEDEKADAAVKKNSAPLAARIQNKFIEQRKIFLWGPVTDESAKDITEKLLYLEAEGPG